MDSHNLTHNPMLDADVDNEGFSVINSYATPYCSTCGSYYVLGGAGSLSSGSKITKTYNDLLNHFRVRISFFFMKIDDWNGENVKLSLNSNSLPIARSFTSSDDTSVMKLCGTAGKTEAVRPIDIAVNQTDTDLVIEISTDLASEPSVASWGIYDFNFSIDKCDLTHCLTCSGPTLSDCLSCNPGFFLQTSPPSTCESLCPDGFYSDPNTNTCPACKGSCKTCSGPLSTNCISCTGTSLLVVGSSFTCTTCPDDTWLNIATNMCQSCDPNCKTCSAGNANDCNSCAETKYFINNQCWTKCPSGCYGVNGTMTCEESCPDETFAYTESNTCCPCNNCMKCVGFGAEQCITCKGTQLMEDGTCVNTCSSNHFINQANSSCDSNFFFNYFNKISYS